MTKTAVPDLSVSDLSVAVARPGRPSAFPLKAVGIIALLAGAAVLAWNGGRVHPHAPDLSLIARQPLILKLHVVGALTALLIGAVLLASPKGRTFHKTLGWTWAIAMGGAVVASFFLYGGITSGRFSPIHLLSGYSAVMLPLALLAARRRRIVTHRRMMTSLYLFGLITAGAFTFAPGRLMWRLFLG